MEKDREEFKSTLRHGIEATIFEGLPASLGLIMVAEPAIRLLFQHGQISGHDADLIGQSLFFYAGAIWAFSILQIINRALLRHSRHRHARGDVRAEHRDQPGVEIPLLWWMGESAMAVGTLASFAVQALIMLWLLDRRVGGLGLSRIAVPSVKMLLATCLMGLALWLFRSSGVYPNGERRLVWAGQLGLLLAVGSATYLGACAVLRCNLITRQSSP